MDRTAWIAVSLCTAGLILYYAFFVPRRTQDPAPSAAPAGETPSQPQISSADVPPPADPDDAAEDAPPEQLVILRNGLAEFTFTTRGGGIKSIRLLHHAAEGGGYVTLNDHGRAPIGALSRIPGDPVDSLAYEIIGEESDDQRIVFRAQAPDGLLITKAYAIREGKEADGHVVNLRLMMANPTDTELTGTDFSVYAGSASPLEPNEWIKPSICWNDSGDADHEAVTYFGPQKFLFFTTGPPRHELKESIASARWAGVYNQFYATLLTPQNDFESTVWARPVPAILSFAPSGGDGLMAIEGGMSLPPLRISPGMQVPYSIEIFGGPRSYTMLRDLGHDRAEVMFYGIFAPISKVLMLLMVWIHDWVLNYGVSIIIVTFIIRIFIWPLYAKSTHTMKRMSLLTPKMTELREKYKDDPQKQQQEMMRLYKDYGINPLGGCLPLLLQIPIFFGFYRMLQSAVELRGESFLWVGDLSMPDTVATVAGIPINPLPLLMAGTMIIQMAVAPKSGDKMQQRIFMIMPVVFLFICYSFASALALYWTAQNIFSIGQTLLMRRIPEPALEKKAKPKRPQLPPSPMGGKPRKPKKPRPPRTGGASKSAARRRDSD